MNAYSHDRERAPMPKGKAFAAGNMSVMVVEDSIYPLKCSKKTEMISNQWTKK